VKIATDNDTNLPPEKLKAATQNEQNDGWLIVKNRPLAVSRSNFSSGSILTQSRQLILVNQMALPAKRGHTRDSLRLVLRFQ
jgi:hypothetical protein